MFSSRGPFLKFTVILSIQHFTFAVNSGWKEKMKCYSISNEGVEIISVDLVTKISVTPCLNCCLTQRCV